jgi:hypothetical protein
MPEPTIGTLSGISTWTDRNQRPARNLPRAPRILPAKRNASRLLTHSGPASERHLIHGKRRRRGAITAAMPAICAGLLAPVFLGGEAPSARGPVRRQYAVAIPALPLSRRPAEDSPVRESQRLSRRDRHPAGDHPGNCRLRERSSERRESAAAEPKDQRPVSCRPAEGPGHLPIWGGTPIARTGQPKMVTASPWQSSQPNAGKTSSVTRLNWRFWSYPVTLSRIVVAPASTYLCRL